MSKQQLEHELEQNPYNIRALGELALIFATEGDYSSASACYDKIVRTDDSNLKAWTALGHCCLLKGEYQRCFSAYRRALQMSQEDPQLWYGVGLLYNKFDNYEIAESAYQRVLGIDPNFNQKNEIFYKLGLIYKKTSLFDKALAYFKNSTSNVPVSRKIEVLCHIGKIHEMQGNLQFALEAFQEALVLEPDNHKTIQFLSWTWHLLSNDEEALNCAVRALTLVRDNFAETGDLHYLCGIYQYHLKRFKDGQTSLQNAIYNNPNAYLYWCSIGILYGIANQIKDAFDCLVKATNLNSDSGYVWLNMGILYEICNQRHEACLAYQRALSLDNTLFKAQERSLEIENNHNLNGIPEFVHPPFEITDVPFSIKKNEKANKSADSLPNIFEETQTSFAQTPFNPMVVQWMMQMQPMIQYMQMMAHANTMKTEEEAAETLAAFGEDENFHRKRQPSSSLDETNKKRPDFT